MSAQSPDLISKLELFASRLSSVRTLDDLIPTVEQILEEIVDVEYNGLYLYDPTTGKLKLYFAKGFTEAERVEAERTAMDRHPGHVFRSGETVHVPDVRLDQQRYSRDSRRSFHILSRLFLPVKSYDQVVGTFGLASTVANRFTEEDISVMSFVCNLSGVIYANILYQKKEEESSRKISRYQDQLKFLADSAMDLISIQDEEDLFYYLKKQLSVLMPGNVAIINQIRGNEVILKDFFGIPITRVLKYTRQFGWDPFAKPYPLEQRFVEIFKLCKVYRFPGGFSDLAEPYMPRGGISLMNKVFGFKEALTIGISKNNNLYGAIHIIIRDEDNFPETSVLESFVNQCSVVIQQIRLKEDLLQAKIEAEIATRSKAQFLSMMSHEIRTPLNAIIGLTHILLMDVPKDSQLENLKSIKFSADNLLVIINDILDYNKIESGKIQFETIDFQIGDFSHGIIRTFKPLAEEKNLVLKLEIDPSLPPVITGDKTRLSQILVNLLSNAIKFTPRGSVTLKISKLGIRQKQVRVGFQVIDTGIGIEDDAKGRIFEDFIQARQDTTRKYGGTGLGLAIVKKLVEMQGGKIDVTSKVGKGTSFNVELSFYYASKLPETHEKAGMQFTPLTGISVLLAEDNKINQLVAKQFLNRWEIEFEIVENGEQAYEAVKSKAFNLILMDLEMPVMDGYEATRKIRELSDPVKSNIPIIALSASAMNEIQEKAKKTGMNSFVTKPFEPCDLYLHIRDLVRPTS